MLLKGRVALSCKSGKATMCCGLPHLILDIHFSDDISFTCRVYEDLNRSPVRSLAHLDLSEANVRFENSLSFLSLSNLELLTLPLRQFLHIFVLF